jgi:hypothetical protein
MKTLLKIFGFIFSWLSPFGVIFVNHVILEETQYNVDMFGLLLVLILIIALVKYIDGRVKVWDIRNEHKVFRLNWNNGKKILLTGLLTWSLYTIEDSMAKIQWSGVLITTSFAIGWFLTLLSNLINKKATS